MPAVQPQSHPPTPEEARERTLQGLFLGSPVPMLLVELRSRRITRANGAMGELLDRPPEELAGVALRDLDAADRDDISEHLLLALACGDQSPRRRSWLARSGQPVEVEVRAARLHGDRGTLLVLYARDVTADPLIPRVPPDAQERMAQKAEAQSRLAAGFATELGTILDDLTGTLRQLQGDLGADPALASGLERFLESRARARRLLRDFLGSVGEPMPRGRVSLNEVVKDAEETLREGLPQDLGFMVSLCREATDVIADPDQLREILVRLVERAHLAIHDVGYVVVSTESVTLDEAFADANPPARPGPHVLLSVTDTGEAVSEEDLARLFEPFSGCGTPAQGINLGLASANGMVKGSGGTIQVVSRLGAGTTFRVYLPRAEG